MAVPYSLSLIKHTACTPSYPRACHFGIIEECERRCVSPTAVAPCVSHFCPIGSSPGHSPVARTLLPNRLTPHNRRTPGFQERERISAAIGWDRGRQRRRTIIHAQRTLGRLPAPAAPGGVGGHAITSLRLDQCTETEVMYEWDGATPTSRH